MTDFNLTNHGSIMLLRPITDAAKDWIDTFIGHGPDVQYLGNSVAIEPRYINDILAGIERDGYTLD